MTPTTVSLPTCLRSTAAARATLRFGARWTCLLGLFLATPALGQESAQVTARADPSAQGTSAAPTGAPVRLICFDSIMDQATGFCLEASSTPQLGLLLPYSGINNLVSGTVAFVGGGESNLATGVWSTVGAGFNNIASGDKSTVAGGRDNTASFTDCTVSGGELNSAVSGGATVGGGGFNRATGPASVVAGGQNNMASGMQAAVPGGLANSAVGDWSLAAGRRAKANHDGAFVWGDSNNVDKASSAANEFNVYASGGVRMFTDSSATTGAVLAAGSGSWSMLSDRNAKENLQPVDSTDILEGVLALPLATWSYKEQGEAVRHLGPMAQDFHRAFGLGVSDKMIDAVDPDGIALAAIQGLDAKLQAELTTLRAEKDAEISELVARLERLEASRPTR